MDKPINVTPQAQRDFDSAYLWYEQQNQGLGKDFAQSVDEKIKEIHRSPLHFQIIYEEVTRRALISRFPYAIYFVDKPDELIIFAILRQSRNPELWKARR